MAELSYHDVASAVKTSIANLSGEVGRLRNDFTTIRSGELHATLHRIEQRLERVEYETNRHDPESEQCMRQLESQVYTVDTRLRALEAAMKDLRAVVDLIYRDETAARQAKQDDEEYRTI